MHFRMSRPDALLHNLTVSVLAACQGSDSGDDAAIQVCERLRPSLGKLTGNDGFASLLRRAVALAAEDCPSALQGVSVSLDGRLQGFSTDPTTGGSEGASTDANAAALAITSRLLHLLITFIGEPLTLRLVRQTWPNISLPEENPRIENDR